jgi:hypothetical protein
VSSVDIPLGPIAPRCATHPEEAATGTCSRCGTFFCAGCVRWIFDKAWCAACAARPEIDYLERFRLKLWGRRDATTWVIGVVGLGLAVVAGLGGTVVVLGGRGDRGLWLWVLVFGAGAVASAAFFLGMRWAREALMGVWLSCAVACWLFRLEGAAFFFLFLGIGAVFSYFDTRNRLFFKRPVSPARLQRLWHVRENNPRARDAMNLGLASFFFPLFAPLAIVFGVVALRRVDPHAMPPIGRKGQAIIGIVLGVGLLALWSVLLWRFFARDWFDLG